MKQFPINSQMAPSTVLLIDDNQRYLDNASLNMDPHSLTLALAEPSDALKAIESAPQISTDPLSEHDESCHYSHLDIGKIHQTIYDPKRFDAISVALVDYAMPSMNGIKFCQRLSHSPIKKALVTGQADQNVAIDAFNKGIIDKFIVKDSPNFYALINETVKELQEGYFNALSLPVLTSLPKETQDTLKDPVFIGYFNENLSIHGIVEYYLLDESGSFFCLDAEGKPSILLVKQADELTTYAQIAQDNEAPDNIVSSLRNKTHIPLFYDEKDNETPVDQWQGLLHTAQEIKGENTYYVSYLADVTAKLTQDVISYNQHLVNL